MTPKTAECPMERAMMGLDCAVQDLEGVLLLARTPAALTEIRSTAEEAIARLIVLSSTCLTLSELL